ncbi:MAG: nucleotide exchange factor GrpE [Eggerthellaceae bacterium]
MTKPRKDEVLETPEAGVDQVSGGAKNAAGASGNKAAQSVEAEVIDAQAVAAQDEEEAAEKSTLSPEDALTLIRAEVEAWKDKHLRLQAEWDTYRRRTNEQRTQEKARAAEKLVESLIPVIDDFERTIDYAQKNGEIGLLEGIEAVHTKFVGVLDKDGVSVIDPQGEAFDALEAQAVGTVEDAETPDETVAEVYQKGYRMGNKVLRPAMVTVTTGGPKREAPQDEAKN